MPSSLHVIPAPTRVPVVDNAVMGTLIFIVTEVMLFGGLISALAIVRAGTLGPWPPPDQPRLPIEATAFNSVVLLASGVALYFAQRAFKRRPVTARRPLAIAIGLGTFFVVFQGFEWVQLLAEGLTIASSTLGGFFYLIVGMHALHAVGALIALVAMSRRLSRLKLLPSPFKAAQLFWYFVVGMWPILYVQVYL
jgi:cytochrome c oxidase subunit 3